LLDDPTSWEDGEALHVGLSDNLKVEALSAAQGPDPLDQFPAIARIRSNLAEPRDAMGKRCQEQFVSVAILNSG
jgi:hypothetical protein